jgi:predicted aspartyl protease
MRSAWIFAALALLLPGAARAENCGPLKIAGQADMLSTQGALLIPAKVNGHSIRMILDTGGWYLELSPSVVKTLGLPVAKRTFGLIDITGHTTNKTTTVDDFEIGSFKAKNVAFLVPDRDYDKGIDGLMGPKLFKVLDLDLDFGARKVNFVLQDHCAGKVVYWNTPSYAAVRFALTDEGHIRLPVELDGRKFTALLDTGSELSAISERAAQEAFGITKDSPGVARAGSVNGDKSAPEYERRFKTLTIAGITFNNPRLALLPDLLRNHMINAHRPQINSLIDTNDETEGVDDVTIGLEELRRLHVYIAYKEKTLYISPLSASPPNKDANAPH